MSRLEIGGNGPSREGQRVPTCGIWPKVHGKASVSDPMLCILNIYLLIYLVAPGLICGRQGP